MSGSRVNCKAEGRNKVFRISEFWEAFHRGQDLHKLQSLQARWLRMRYAPCYASLVNDFDPAGSRCIVGY